MLFSLGVMLGYALVYGDWEPVLTLALAYAVYWAGIGLFALLTSNVEY